jgi:hypothetical protein
MEFQSVCVFVNLVVASSKQISASRFLLTGAGKGQCREKAMSTEMPRKIDFQEKEISVGKAVKRKMRQDNIKQRDLENTMCEESDTALATANRPKHRRLQLLQEKSCTGFPVPLSLSPSLALLKSSAKRKASAKTTAPHRSTKIPIGTNVYPATCLVRGLLELQYLELL